MVVIRAGLLALALLGIFLGVVPMVALSRAIGLSVPPGLSQGCCAVLLRLLGIELEIEDGPPSAGARLVVANHVSWIDVLALARIEPFCFVAKSEIASWPLVSAFAAAHGTVFVDRRRRRCIPAVNRAIAERLGQGRSVLLFPEGTTHDGTTLGPFRTSHLASLGLVENGSPRFAVQPLTISYTHPRAAWVGDAALLPHVWTVLCGRPIRCRITLGEAQLVPHGFNRKMLGASLRDRVDAMLDDHDRLRIVGQRTGSEQDSQGDWRPRFARSPRIPE